MQQRVPLLIVTGALAFGSIAYFLFFFDDGSIPKETSIHTPTMRPRHTGAGANSASPAASSPPMSPPAVPIATTPAPSGTGPPE